MSVVSDLFLCSLRVPSCSSSHLQSNPHTASPIASVAQFVRCPRRSASASCHSSNVLNAGGCSCSCPPNHPHLAATAPYCCKASCEIRSGKTPPSRAVKSLANPISLWGLRFRTRVVDVLNCQVQLILELSGNKIENP
jgi:hypothetical protein